MKEKWDKSDRFGLAAFIYLIINLIALVLYFIFYPVLVGQETIDMHNFDWTTFWQGVGASVVASAIIAIGTNIINYYVNLKKLKKIPTETKQQIEDLLDKRLGNDTDNHNTELTALSNAKTELSHQHTRIEDLVRNTEKQVVSVSNKMDTAAKVEETYRANLTDNQKAIVDCVKKLEGFSEELKRVNYRNKTLESEMRIKDNQMEQMTKRISYLSSRLEKYEPQPQSYHHYQDEQDLEL